MGSTKDPADGKAVAGSVFAAVVVYAVCNIPSERVPEWSFGYGICYGQVNERGADRSGLI